MNTREQVTVTFDVPVGQWDDPQLRELAIKAQFAGIAAGRPEATLLLDTEQYSARYMRWPVSMTSEPVSAVEVNRDDAQFARVWLGAWVEL